MDVTLEQLIPLIPALPLAGAVVNGLLGARLPRGLVHTIACGVMLAAFLIGAWAFAQLGAEQSVTRELYTWMAAGGLDVSVGLRLDALSALMTLVVTGVGFVIHLYSIGYMEHDPSYARYFAYLNLFAFAMLVLVLGDSLPVLFVGWEGVGLCSYLLIGFWYSDVNKAAAGKKAFVVNRIGDFGFIVAMLLLFRVTGTLEFAALSDAAGAAITPAVATGACLMLILGATGKSAQIPLYVWLPDAMAGPTPVSALIHAATMVTAGVYLTARLHAVFALAPVAMLTLATIGALTALFAATIGTVQNDIKKVLAYSTVSQLGYMFLAAGLGAYAVAVFHLVTHAFFKACLFLGSGSVIHGMSGEQDMRHMGGLWKKMPVTFVTFLLATLAITGFPLMAGFMSKDAILWNAWIADHGAHAEIFAGIGKGLWLLGVLAAVLTSFYMWRLVFMTFFSGKLRASEEVAHHVHESPWTMTVPLGVLGLLSVVGGALGVPHILGGHDWIGHWLRPVVGASPVPDGDHVTIELILMSLSVLGALAGFVAAFILYAKGFHPLTRRFASERPWAWLYERLLGKWHVDELYDVAVVKPLGWLSYAVLYQGIDRRIIDGLVNFVGAVARSVGFLFQLFQTGNIQKYLAVFVVALALLLYSWLTPAADTGADAARTQSAPALEEAVQVPTDVLGTEGGRR